MGKSKHKISNWKQYNQALVQRGSLTVWMDEQAIQQWHCQTHHGRRGRGFHYSDSAIETALMLKAVFKLPLRALEGFINSLFKLMKVPLQSPDYSCISKRAKTVEIKYRLPCHFQKTNARNVKSRLHLPTKPRINTPRNAGSCLTCHVSDCSS
ncbi:hypothetical protein KAM344_23620 [Aeromonas caviae]|nr:hypothetical protein KAM334_31550 [Aeromonas caviae]GJC02055.1 hypothetical protein KAM384_33360 [Aeromonas caviae]GKQ67197.1 hypothetical protein KAM344_23620 [Aeromonas caviae]